MQRSMTGQQLICRIGARLCALPVEHVDETMRPLPVEPFAGAPAFMTGIAIIRGEPVPVVDVARLLGGERREPARFVTIRVNERVVALAVGDVLDVRSIPADTLRELPPLLRDKAMDAVAAIGVLDRHLALVLESARLVPESAWAALAARERTV